MRRVLEADRGLILIITFGLTLLAWLIVASAPSAPLSGVVDLVALALFMGVWSVGMVAMMLPSVLPMIFILSKLGRVDTQDDPSTNGMLSRLFHPAEFALGYLGVWWAVGLLAYFGPATLFRFFASSPQMNQLTSWGAGIAIFLAGLYQFSPLKQKALRACRSPMTFIVTKWRGGRLGRFLMGIDYSFFCTRCCWAFMAVLVVVGAMSLLWMVLFAVVIFVEKVAPRGLTVSKILGALLMVSGSILMALPQL